jgi:CheY-like chemotaxis protein
MDTTRILIIDDEPDFTALLKANLEEVGNFEVMEINDSSHALKAAREFMPELCVIDVVMPGLDGGDVVAQFRADPELKDVAVLMLTALVEENPNTPDGETQTGGLPFVSKTSEFGTILSCIEKHIEEVRDRPAAEEEASRTAEVWDLG